MKNYRNFKILNEYHTDEKISEYTAFVWDKGSHWKSEVYGKNSESGYIGIGDTLHEAVTNAIDKYWQSTYWRKFKWFIIQITRNCRGV